MLPSPPPDAAGARALVLVHHQFSGNWEALRAQLDAPAGPARVDPLRLAEAWSEALRQVGELTAVEEPALLLADDLSVVAEVPLHFARGDLRERVTFDAAGHVAAVALLPEPLPD